MKNNIVTSAEIIGGYNFNIGSSVEEKISSLQSLKDSMANCMMIGLNDDLAFDKSTTQWLQTLYLQADHQIHLLQKRKPLIFKN